MKSELVKTVAERIVSEAIMQNGTREDAWRIANEVLVMHRFSKPEELKIMQIVEDELKKHNIM